MSGFYEGQEVKLIKDNHITHGLILSYVENSVHIKEKNTSVNREFRKKWNGSFVARDGTRLQTL